MVMTDLFLFFVAVVDPNIKAAFVAMYYDAHFEPLLRVVFLNRKVICSQSVTAPSSRLSSPVTHYTPNLNGEALNAVRKLYYKGVKGCSKMVYVVNKIKFLSAKMRGV